MTADRQGRRGSSLLIGAVLVVTGGFLGAVVMRGETRDWVEGAVSAVSDSIASRTADIPRLVAALDSFRSEHRSLRSNVDSLQAVLQRHMGDGPP